MAPPASFGREDNPYRGQKETRACVRCGDPVTRYLRPSSINAEWTCSKACANAYFGHKPRRGDYIACETCGKEFYRQPAYIAQNRRFCSQPCWNEAQKKESVERVCAYCGATFSVRPSQQAQMFCKRECYANGTITRPLDRMHNGRPARLNDKGYVLVWEPDHPNAYNGWMLEHRLVMEQHLGRRLRTNEQVDHIRASEKANNAISNLQLLSPSDHSKKTNADNLGALPGLRSKVEQLESELAALRAQLKVPVLQ